MKEIMLKRLKPLIIQLIIFGITYSISFVLRDRYFFGWLIHNNFAHIWVVMIILTMFGKYLYSYAIAIGNINRTTNTATNFGRIYPKAI